MNQFVVEGLVIGVVLTASALAQAEEVDPEASGKPPAAEEAAPAEAVAPAATAANAGGASSSVADGARFRFGVGAGIGFFTAATEVGPDKLSCTYFGTTCASELRSTT